MILLQVATDTLGGTQNATIGGIFFPIEVIILIAVVIYQLVHSVKVHKNIEELQDIFTNGLFIKNGLGTI